MVVERIYQFESAEQIQKICMCLQKFTELSNNNSQSYNKIMFTVISCDIKLIDKLNEQIGKNQKKCYLAVQSFDTFSALQNALIKIANQTFIQLSTNIHLRTYANQFRKYYIKFAKYMKDITNGQIIYQIDNLVTPEDTT